MSKNEIQKAEASEIQKNEDDPRNTSIESMIVRGIDKGISVDVMERLLNMRRELRSEQAKEAYDKAMAEFQARCPVIKKTKIVYEKGSNRIRYSYAPIESIVVQVKELIRECGFSYSMDAETTPEGIRAVCKITHEMGHSEKSSFEVPINKDAYMSESQKVASALTFAKRYAFCNTFGIMTGDEDDDNQISIPSRQVEPTRVEKKTDVEAVKIVEDKRLLIKELLERLGERPETQRQAVEAVRKVVDALWRPGMNDDKIIKTLQEKAKTDPVEILAEALAENKDERDV